MAIENETIAVKGRLLVLGFFGGIGNRLLREDAVVTSLVAFGLTEELSRDIIDAMVAVGELNRRGKYLDRVR